MISLSKLGNLKFDFQIVLGCNMTLTGRLCLQIVTYIQYILSLRRKLFLNLLY